MQETEKQVHVANQVRISNGRKDHHHEESEATEADQRKAKQDHVLRRPVPKSARRHAVQSGICATEDDVSQHHPATNQGRVEREHENGQHSDCRQKTLSQDQEYGDANRCHGRTDSQNCLGGARQRDSRLERLRNVLGPKLH